MSPFFQKLRSLMLRRRKEEDLRDGTSVPSR